MKCLLLNGWGLSTEDASHALPICESHQVIHPTSTWHSQVLASQAEMLVGYSTGAFLALSKPELFARFNRIVLLAPFVDYKAEAGLGGRVKTVQLKLLLRQLSRDPLTAVIDFHHHAGLKVPVPCNLPLPVEDLRWGIERLLHDRSEASALAQADCFIGSEDPLLDANAMSALFPNLKVLPSVGHDLGDLAVGAGLVG